MDGGECVENFIFSHEFTQKSRQLGNVALSFVTVRNKHKPQVEMSKWWILFLLILLWIQIVTWAVPLAAKENQFLLWCGESDERGFKEAVIDVNVGKIFASREMDDVGDDGNFEIVAVLS